MKVLYPTFKPKIDLSPLAKYVRSAFNVGLDIKRKKGVFDRIEHCDQYFANKATWPDSLFICMNQSNDSSGSNSIPDELRHPSHHDLLPPPDKPPTTEQGIHLHLDTIALKISTFLSVITDAIREVDKPWVITPSPKPEFPDDINAKVQETLLEVVTNNMMAIAQGDKEAYYHQLIAMITNMDGAFDILRTARDEVYEFIMAEYEAKAAESAKIIDVDIYDLIKESDFDLKLDMFFSNFARYDFAVLKTPQFSKGFKHQFVKGKLTEVSHDLLSHEIIHPANYFCSDDSTFDKPGNFELDICNITLTELIDIKNSNIEGFVSDQIDQAVDYFKDRGRDWLSLEYNANDQTENWQGYESIPVIKYYGKISDNSILPIVSIKQAKELREKFGAGSNYECVLWVIQDYVIYCSISLSKVVSRPYRVSSYSKHGSHKFDGKGLWTICYPYQRLMDNYHELLFKNVGLSSVGIITYNPRKIDLDSFDASMIRPGARIPVTTSFQDGANDRVISQVSFDSHIGEILPLIQHIDNEMDRVSEIPSSSIGFGEKLSSIRSTGIASLNQAAINKAVLRKVYIVEFDVIKPTIKSLLLYTLLKTKDPRVIRGAIDIVVSGYSGVMRKQTKAQNLDLVMQNAIGIVNAITSLQTNGVDVSGLWYLFKVYLEQSGIDSNKIIPSSISVKPPDTSGAVGGELPQLDGRSTATMVNDKAM